MSLVTNTEAMLLETIPWEDPDAAPPSAIIGRCGLGTVENPLIEWTCNMSGEDDIIIHYECEAILQRLANELQCTHVSVSRPARRAIEAWNRLIEERTGTSTSTNPQWLEQADRHLTVRFGTEPSRCDMLGHIYLAVDRGHVLDVMNRREYVVGYDDRVLQVWCWTQTQYSELLS